MFFIGLCATAFNLTYSNGIAKIVAMSSFTLLFIIACIRSQYTYKPQLFKRWLFYILIMVLVDLCYGITNLSYPITHAMPLMIAFSSTYLFCKEKDNLVPYIIMFGIFASFCSVVTVINGMGSIVVALDSYSSEIEKNQVAPFFSSISTVTTYLMLQKNTKLYKRCLLGLISIFCLYPALYLSCRTALICYFLITVLLVWKEYKITGLVIGALMIVGILLLGGDGLYQTVYDSIIGNRDVHDFNSMTSNRGVIVERALKFIPQHFFFGIFGDQVNYYPLKPHIFILQKLMYYGLWGVIPYILLYVSIFRLFFKSLKFKHYLAIGALSLPLLESFAEYMAPFGPGTVYVFCYIIIGLFIREYYNIQISK